MSFVQVSCPGCQMALQVPATEIGKKARCSECKLVFPLVAIPSPPTPAIEAPPAEAPATTDDGSFYRRLAEADDPFAKPAPASAEPDPLPLAELAPSPEPTPRRAKRVGPRRAKPVAGQSGRGFLYAMLAGIAFFGIAGCAGAGYLVYAIWSHVSEEFAATERPGADATGQSIPGTNGINAAQGQGKPGEPPPETPGDRIKNATVQVRVTFANGVSGNGSGFLVSTSGPASAGVVVTAAQVLDPGARAWGRNRQPETIEVVVHSGKPVARTLSARVLRSDPATGVVLLRLTAENLPRPLLVGDTSRLTETDEVQIFGFAAAPPNRPIASVTPAIVSGLRREGAVPEVRLSGGVHPGNAGGPVTDKTYQVVGMAAGGAESTLLPTLVSAEAIRDFLKVSDATDRPATSPPGHSGPGDVPEGVPNPEARGPIEVPGEGFPNGPGPGFPNFPNMPNPGFGKGAGRARPRFPPMPDDNQGPFPNVPNPGPAPPRNEPPGPPKAKMIFPPVVPVEIPPLAVAGDAVEVALPGKVTDSCIGGGGRYWFLLVPTRQEVLVFDVSAGKVTRTVPAPAGAALIAAGMNKLVVADLAAGKLHRYDLTTFAEEASVRVPVAGPVRQMAMGSASGGPLLVEYTHHNEMPPWPSLAFLDLATFQELDPGPGGLLPKVPVGFHRGPMRYRASPDGMLFGSWGGGEHFWHTFRLSATQVTVQSYHAVGVVVAPVDGGIALASDGVYPADAQRPLRWPNNTLRVPAQQGAAYLAITGQRWPERAGGLNMVIPINVAVHVLGSDQPICTLRDPGVTLPLNFMPFEQPGIPADRRVLFSPAAHVIAYIPPTDDRIVVTPFDLDAALAKTDVDYLFVSTRPPAAEPGKPFRYTVGVKSKAGGVKVELVSGPVGMAVNGREVVWDVPKGKAVAEQVTLNITNEAGRTTTQVFHLAAREP